MRYRIACIIVLLRQVPRVTVIPSMYFPKEELWEKADLVVFYFWSREKWDYDLIDRHQVDPLVFVRLLVPPVIQDDYIPLFAEGA